ncbi:hypothetical protein V6V47_25780 [Micromonospora sp. CPCC 205539]|uniref:hypothetical protein n=1 Tax=Micromonospora sp. CPCC 205539 TaxID=3122408 RepID=UPI002FF27EB5
MTRAPSNLSAVRSLLLTHLNVDPNTVRAQDLEPAEVGIVGDPAHRGGYHCGSDRVDSGDYSVDESPRDKAGLTLDAAALDVGSFDVRSGGRTNTLPSFSIWCVAQCAANAADARDIREIIYSPDGSTVKRWDRLGKRSTGDSTHRWHTHFSFFRDAVKAGRDQTPLFRRYLSTIGLLKDNDMTPEEHTWLATVHQSLTVLDGRNPIGQTYTRMTTGTDATVTNYVAAHPTLKSLAAQLATLQVGLTTLSAKDLTDEPAIIQGVLAGLSPEDIAAAIPPTLARQVADELARRLVV